MFEHVDPPLLAIDVECDEPFDRSGQGRVVLSEDGRPKQYADADTVAPAAMTPLMKVRRECPPVFPCSIMCSPRMWRSLLCFGEGAKSVRPRKPPGYSRLGAKRLRRTPLCRRLRQTFEGWPSAGCRVGCLPCLRRRVGLEERV